MSSEFEREELVNVMVMTDLSDYAGTDMKAISQAVSAILAAGFRRTVQGEPGIRVNMDAPIPYVGTTDDFMVNVRPQGEPTDAAVSAAARALFDRARPGNEYADMTYAEVRGEYEADARAALRAAATQEGDER